MIYQQTQVCTKLQAWGLNLQNNDICCNWWGWRGCVTKPRENVGRFLVTDHHLASMMESVSYMILHHPIISHKQSIEFTAVKCAKPWKMSPEDDVVWQKLPPGQNFKTSIPQRNQRCHKPTGQNSPPKNDLPFQVGMWNLCPRFRSHAKHARGLVNPNCKPCKSCKDSEAPSNLPQIQTSGLVGKFTKLEASLQSTLIGVSWLGWWWSTYIWYMSWYTQLRIVWTCFKIV